MKNFYDNQVPNSSKQLRSQIESRGIDIVFQNIFYSVKIPDETAKSKIPCRKQQIDKPILKGVSGIFKAGKVNAIMGASGAGKTTLLNVLACRINHSNSDEGKLYANNLQYNYQTFGEFANYVMQKDILMETLTVRQTLEFAAQLKLNLPEKQRKQRVLKMAQYLELQKCLDTLVGGVLIKGISGGQKKRTSIAFELITDPQVIFLDEPTSGLDSLTSYIIVSELKYLAHKKNRTVIMTIHQPNSQIYALFDSLTLLLQGKIIYQGPALQISGYFTKKFNLQCPTYANIPDFFMSKIHYEDPKNRERYEDYFQSYDQFEAPKVQKMIQSHEKSDIVFRQTNVSSFTALKALSKRTFINTIRNPMLIRSKVFQGIFLALFVGGLFFDIGTRDYTQRPFWYGISGFLFFMCISSIMSALSPVVLTFPIEREVFFKQQDSKMYTVVQYFLAKNLIELPQLFALPMLVICIYYFMIDLSNTAGQFFLHYLIYCLIAFSGSSLGMLLGSAILDAKSVSAVMPVAMLPVILFSGFFKNRDNLPVWIGWIEYISPIKYGFIALTRNQVAFKASRVDDLHFDVDKWPAIIILACLGIFFRILSLFFLWFLRKKSQ